MKICVTKLVEELTVPDNFKEVFQLQKEKGLREYGELLHTFNGRDALEDLKQELVDSSLYFSQAILEGKREEAINIMLSFIRWTRAIEGKLIERNDCDNKPSKPSKPICPRCASSRVTTVRTPDGGHNCMDCHHHFKNRSNKP